MREKRPLSFLCITTYEKGQEFMRECKRQGCRVILLTAEKLRNADWPRESLDSTFYLPEEIPIADIVKAVTHLARNEKLDRIVALTFRGAQFEPTVKQIVMHVVNHATLHRGQVMAMFRQMEIKPPATDLMGYYLGIK